MPTISGMPWRISKVKAFKNYVLEVTFMDGLHGLVDMSTFIASKKTGVFKVLKNPKVFNQVYVELGVVTWPGEIDLAPDVMHQSVKKFGTWKM
jgi:hypothetical protein